MSGSSYGKLFTITTWGESHGQGVGVVVDGCPAGLKLFERDIQIELNKRRPGQSPYCTPRDEADKVKILSGIFEDRTTGTPISMVVMNKDQRSKDYNDISGTYRPGHADYAFDAKYGFRDYRGGGRSSGRETIARVAAGAIAKLILKELGVQLTTYAKSIGPIEIAYEHFDAEQIYENPFRFPDATKVEETEEYMRKLIKDGNSSGGVIECIVKGMPAGVGEPVFDKMDASLAKALLSIGAVKGFEIGAGFEAARMTGFENNDFYEKVDGKLSKITNHAGGTTGGITDGSDLILRAAVKPTPSIHMTQQAMNRDGEVMDLVIGGRHDPVIVPRAVIVVESMVAITLVDLLLQQMSSRMDYIKKIFQQ
ncbi:MAG: chorismate synthase [Vallitaleaceae bacterium]|nr:chorismate synthase [Vallitaleaceae bacterium]